MSADDRPRLVALPSVTATTIAAALVTNDYDTRLLNLARTAVACQSISDMREWLRARAVEETTADPTAAAARVDTHSDRTIVAMFDGRSKAIMSELIRWIERITKSTR